MRFVFLYMIGMLVFGTTNTIILKLTDMTESRGSDFEHPYFQSAVMFLGESLCLAFYGVIRCMEDRAVLQENDALFQLEPPPPPNRFFRRWGKKLFAIPAFLDLCGSTLMNIGLVLSAASIYQMVRGSMRR